MRPGEIRFHVNGVIELDRTGIRESRTKCCKFRMSGFEVRDAGGEIRHRMIRAEVGVTLRAVCIRRGRELHASPMLDVARRASGRENLIRMVNGPVVASEARSIVRLCTEKSGAHDVARAAILGEHGVRGRHGAGAVELVVVRYAVTHEPKQRRDRQKRREQKTNFAKAMRVLEIVQVNPLREPFGCPLRSRHDSSFPRSS
jgi:hypothetical protein